MDEMQIDSGVEEPFVPFTIPERIQQLGEIDKASLARALYRQTTRLDLVKLMEHTGDAMASLGYKESENPQEQSRVQQETFHRAMNDLLRTLHTVDVHMKRQIMGLKEAGIIVLEEQQPKTSLKPHGMGAVGKLDAAWLNSRSNKVEGDMEAELWAEARKFLEKAKPGPTRSELQNE
ncbi:Mediator complex protein [Ceratocystis platani]|uniref:Mediator of RNA polymerase II transcription subunit 11 n=1 Tax=Ceratocystis fimbriata f. sp. platani TaxID=88771 RepID=A0A0F8B0R7_CERFI|nr:Mediator complex protein [Ceratocystis platani]